MLHCLTLPSWLPSTTSEPATIDVTGPCWLPTDHSSFTVPPSWMQRSRADSGCGGSMTSSPPPPPLGSVPHAAESNNKPTQIFICPPGARNLEASDGTDNQYCWNSIVRLR